ncbi:MAG TPA: hypothetical protein VKJ00_03460 [Thermoanaerobaculia bacterium]|nr:hypothetical protein [Thermoanaerobaculia bacterium]
MNLPRLAALGSVLLLASGAAQAAAGGRYDLSVVVDGVTAAEYPFQSKTYIEAIRGRSFTLRISNPTAERVAVALSVDGRNVIDAKRTSAGAATKWVLSPGQILEVPGWQVSGQTARRFFFTETSHSYAKWLGDTANVGTIEAVFFRERAPRHQAWTPPREPEPLTENDRSDAPNGTVGGAPQMQGEAKSRDSAQAPPEAGASGSRREMMQPRPTEADRFAATGIGERTSNPIEWVDFDGESTPAARISLRYEFRTELVRLGVLPRADDLFARERGRGFEPEYAPDPGRIH